MENAVNIKPKRQTTEMKIAESTKARAISETKYTMRISGVYLRRPSPSMTLIADKVNQRNVNFEFFSWTKTRCNWVYLFVDNIDQSQQTSRSSKCTLDLEKFRAWLDSKKDQKSLMKSEDLSVLEQTTQLTHKRSYQRLPSRSRWKNYLGG